MQSPGELVAKEVQDFKTKPVMLTSGTSYSQYDTIQRENRYIAGEFMDCPDPNAMFWQLSNQRIPLYAKSIDMDTKDFYVVGVGKTNWFQAWILNVRYKKWSRESRLALTLDDVSTGIATHGSMVWKKVETDGVVGIEAADLRNLYFDPTVKNIIESPVVELHYMTETEIRYKWADKADEVIEKAKQRRDSEDHEAESEDEKYEVWERWGEFKKELDDDAKYFRFVGVGAGDLEVILTEDEITLGKNGKPKDFPYYDFHGERVSGRWKALSVPERLFGLQEQINTLVNQNNEANSIASLFLFRTEDPGTTGNILQSAQSGQIINSQDMQQLGIDNRFISTFLNQLQSIESKADSLCYVNDSISGDTPPSGVPFRSLAVATRAALSTFRYIKTSIGEKMGYVLQEEVLPSIIKGFNREDIIEIAEDEEDIRIYDDRLVDQAIEDFKIERASMGLVVFEEDLEVLKVNTRKSVQRNRRIEEIGKKFFDFEYGIVMNPSGKSVEKNVQNAAIDGALEMMIAAPAIVNTPLFKQKLANNNIPPFRLTVEEQAELSQSATGKPVPEAPVDTLSKLAEE